ncbi:MAG: c-type cytochrome [Phormidesmis sp.]
MKNQILKVGFRAWLSICLYLSGLLFWMGGAEAVIAQSQSQPSPVEMAPSVESEKATPEQLFSANCAACHAHGGNIIRRGKTLRQRALTRNGYAEADAIATLITQGKGAMPAYGDRLSEPEIEVIATYVKQQAESGW